jgi:hypothetical protein
MSPQSTTTTPPATPTTTTVLSLPNSRTHLARLRAGSHSQKGPQEETISTIKDLISRQWTEEDNEKLHSGWIENRKLEKPLTWKQFQQVYNHYFVQRKLHLFDTEENSQKYFPTRTPSAASQQFSVSLSVV